jgi:predicted secreted protein
MSGSEAVMRPARCAARLCLAMSLLLGVVAGASAGPTLALDAQARSEVANDEMVVVLAAERDGPQVGPLNDAVLAQLNAAIAEARAVEGVRTRMGSISTQPNYGRDGRPQGWRVRGELVLVSSRIPALSQLGGRLAERLQLAGVQFRLSAERRRTEEARLLAEAASAFRTRAGEAAAAFGFKGYELKELTLRSPGSGVPRPMAMARGAAEAPSSSAPLPAEGGESEVVVAVSGTVVLLP